jgi:hypothetical protein
MLDFRDFMDPLARFRLKTGDPYQPVVSEPAPRPTQFAGLSVAPGADPSVLDPQPMVPPRPPPPPMARPAAQPSEGPMPAPTSTPRPPAFTLTPPTIPTTGIGPPSAEPGGPVRVMPPEHAGPITGPGPVIGGTSLPAFAQPGHTVPGHTTVGTPAGAAVPTTSQLDADLAAAKRNKQWDQATAALHKMFPPPKHAALQNFRVETPRGASGPPHIPQGGPELMAKTIAALKGRSLVEDPREAKKRPAGYGRNLPEWPGRR